MSVGQIKKIIEDHLTEGETECRWCFAVDMQRIKGQVIATYNYPDATLVHLSCPRCKGEFTLYFNSWGEDYLKDIISKLHPEFKNKISNKLFREVNDRVCPE